MKRLLMALALAACQAPAPKTPVTPASAADSTFLVEGVLGYGTAWIAKPGTLVTAGHVCTHALPLKLTNRAGASFPVKRLVADPKWDLCVIYAEVQGRPLEAAPRDPELYEPVAYVGAPKAYFGCINTGWGDVCGVAPMYRGAYSGGNIISAPTAPGASGSAVFTSEGVIGVLVGVDKDFDGLVYIEPRDRLVEFLADK